MVSLNTFSFALSAVVLDILRLMSRELWLIDQDG